MAQPKAPRIAYVYLFKEGPTAPFLEAFRGRMGELGWVDGTTVRIEPRDAQGSEERLVAIMRELVDTKVDVIVAMCTPEARVAARMTSSIPIVMAATGDPVAAKLVASMARPGGNVTGVSAMFVELSAKRLELLKAAFPAVTRATLVWNPERPDNTPEVNAMLAAAERVGVKLESRPVRTVDELTAELDALVPGSTQALLNVGDRRPGCPYRPVRRRPKAAGDVRGTVVCRCRGSDVLWSEPGATAPPRGGLRRSHPEGSQAG